MNSVIVLDTGPLGLLCNPNPNPLALRCQRWITDLYLTKRQIIVPEIADYELRRSLLRNRSRAAIKLLDGFGTFLQYLSISTEAMLLAAELWAQARQGGYQTAGNDSLDADVILAAQALSLNLPVVIATTNVRHIGRFVPAEEWQTVVP